MKHGDLFWVDLPDRGGREQRGRRPAIIWQDTDGFPGLPTVLLIPLTSRLAALRFPATVRVEPSSENGLAVPSVALVFQLGASDIGRVRDRLGELSVRDLARVGEIARRLQKLI